MKSERTIESEIQFLPGVGPKRAEKYAELGIRTVRDLLTFFPSGHVDRSLTRPIDELKTGERVTIVGRVLSTSAQSGFYRTHLFKAVLVDGTGGVEVVWFGQKYRVDQIKKDMTVLVSGHLEATKYGVQFMPDPAGTEVISDDPGERKTCPVMPRYALGKAFKNRDIGKFRQIMRAAIDGHVAEFREFLPPHIIKEYGFPSLNDAIRLYHFPENADQLEHARLRIAYEDLFFLSLEIAMKRKSEREQAGIAFDHDPALDKRIRRHFPFELTPAQNRSVAQIVGDMRQPRPMLRLLEGDVGSGKTVVAVYAALVAIAGHAQVAFMAPTEILAEQHYLTLKNMLADTHVRIEFLPGGLAGAERRRILADLADGTIHLLVGTHSLIEERVKFKRLGLVVIDEQHRFGVLQRGKLIGKGAAPDVLVMTATPIPRTLAMTVYGDLDLSVIDELPPGRKPIDTRIVSPSKRDKAMEFIRRELSAGRQAYAVAPLIEESDAIDGEDVTNMFEHFKKDVFSDFRVGLLHGRMRPAEKEDVMHRFRNREFDILAATTVIEVGVDVPNATIMLIESAERFGLAQLHQLRGRVGRGTHQSYCFLLAAPTTDAARKRLEAVRKSTDGFAIAEADLAIRGPGDVAGIQQAGFFRMRAADIVADHRLFLKARDDAARLVEKNPELAAEILRRFCHETGVSYRLAAIA